MQRILKDRELKNVELNAQRLDRIWSIKQNDKEKRFNKIRAEHIKSKKKKKMKLSIVSED